MGGWVGGWVGVHRGLCVLNRCASISQACVRFERVPIPRPTRGAHSRVCTGVAAPRMNARLFVLIRSRGSSRCWRLRRCLSAFGTSWVLWGRQRSRTRDYSCLSRRWASSTPYAPPRPRPHWLCASVAVARWMAAAALCRSERPARVVDEGRAARGVLDRRSCTAFVVAQKYHS